MAITRWPQGVEQNQTVTCVICHAPTTLLDVSAGARSKDGRQSFACNQHFEYSDQFIRGWADFADRELDRTGL